MELECTVHNNAIVPDDVTVLPEEGTRVRITFAPVEQPKSFAEDFAEFKGIFDDLPEDMADQHDHYRLGTPKR